MASPATRASSPSVTEGVRHGKAAQSMGTQGSTEAEVRKHTAPPGDVLYFASDHGRYLLYEFRNGKLASPTWRTRGRSYYQVGDSYGKTKVRRRELVRIFDDAELEPEAKASWRLLLYMLGEEAEQFEIGYEIVSIESRGSGGWDGKLTAKPYYVDPRSKNRRYGKPITLTGSELQAHFDLQRQTSELVNTADLLTTAAVIMVDVGMNAGSAPAKAELKAATRRGIAAALKIGAEDGVVRRTLKKGLGRALRLLIKAGKLLDTIIGAGATAFLKTFIKSLRKDAAGHPAVLKVAADNFVWPATSVVGASGSWVINWQTALSGGVVAAVAAMVGQTGKKLFGGFAEKEGELDKEIAQELHGSAAAHIHDFKFDAELQATVMKWIVTDNLTRIVKVVGKAATDAPTADKFEANLHKELEDDLKEWLKEAFKSTVELFKV